METKKVRNQIFRSLIYTQSVVISLICREIKILSLIQFLILILFLSIVYLIGELRSLLWN